MSREIKFRCWSEKEKAYLDGPGRFLWVSHDDTTSGLYSPTDLQITLEQYTGLKDKNNKEIYEGDILKFIKDPEMARVVWNTPSAEFRIKWLECGVSDSLSWHLHDHGGAEVIGTIHENPELLEDEE